LHFNNANLDLTCSTPIISLPNTVSHQFSASGHIPESAHQLEMIFSPSNYQKMMKKFANNRNCQIKWNVRFSLSSPIISQTNTVHHIF